MGSARQRLQRFKKGVGVLMQQMPGTVQSFFGFMESAQKKNALTAREKELIALGISLYHRCEDCITAHVERALQAGCTREEILEAAGTAMVFGGGPTLASAATVLLEALDEMEKDFQK